MNRNIINCLRRSLATVAIILGMSCMANNAYAQMPTDISYYTDEGIIKTSTNTYNIDIEVKYLAYEIGSSYWTQYVVAFLESPSGVEYNITGNIGNPGFDDYTKYEYIELDGYAFIDLQSIEVGDWNLRLVQSNAGNWYYTTEVLGEDNPNIIAEIEGLKFILNKETLEAKLSANNYSDTEFTVPSTVEHEGKTYTVTSLNGSCFYNCTNIEKITLPRTITTIGSNCFGNCSNLKSLVVTSTTPPTCKGNIRLDNSRNVYVPIELLSTYESDDYWKQYYIRDMSDLPGDIITTEDNLKLQLYPQSQTATLLPNNYDRSGTFTVPETVTYEGVTYTITSLDNECFYHCSNITNISLPSTLKTIGNRCFYYCSALQTMIIPEGVTSLGDNCFEECSTLKRIIVLSTTPPTINSCDISNIYVPEEAVELYEEDQNWSKYNIYSIKKYAGEVITIDGLKVQLHPYDGNNVGLLPNDYNRRTTFEVPETVTAEDGTVYTITYLENECFYNCYYIPSITLPSTIKSLGDKCFWNCAAMTSVNIPDGATDLGKECFNGCSSLTSINIPYGVSSLKEYCFYNCNKLETISIPESVKRLDSYCFAGTGISEVDIPETISELPYGCFSECKNLKTFTIPKHITSLGGECFSRSGISYISIHDGITSLPYRCFECCDINSVIVPEGITELERYCFIDCNKLKKISLPNSLTTIGANCFEWCSSLTSIIIPENVMTIGDDCFRRSGYLLAIKNPTPPTINDLSLDASATIFVPEESVNAYQTHLYWGGFTIKTLDEFPSKQVTVDNNKYQLYEFNTNATLLSGQNIKNIVIPEKFTYEEKEYTVTKIGENALSGCTNINYITIPNTVKTLGKNCFPSSLKMVSIPESVNYIDEGCFSNCTSNLQVEMLPSIPPTRNGDIALPEGTTVFVKQENKSTYENDEYWKNYTIKSLAELCVENVIVGEYKVNIYKTTKEATVIANNYDKAECIQIPSTINWGNETYTITAIGDNCYNGCSNISQIDLPKTVKSIGEGCFSGCSSLTSIIVNSQVPPTCSGDISLPSNASVGVSSDVIDTYNNDGYWKSYNIIDKMSAIPDIIILNGMKYELDKTNFTATLLSLKYNTDEEFVVPETLIYAENTFTITALGKYCFSNCSFHSIYISSITPPTCKGYIGHDNSTNVYVPIELISTYESDDYWKQYYIREMDDLPGDIITTDDNLKLQLYPKSQTATLLRNGYDISGTFSVPETVTHNGVTYTITALYKQCFYSCFNITSFILPNTIKTIGNECFYNCNTLTTINIPQGVTSLGNTCFYFCSALTTIDIHEGLTYLGAQCFGLCKNLSSIILPSSVTQIETNCFDECKSLQKIAVLSTTPPTISSLGSRVYNIYTPEESIASYKSNENWKQYNILSLNRYPGETIEVDGLKYQLYTYDSQNVGLLPYNYNKEGEFTVPATVSANGNTYNVSVIEDDCFNGCSSITSFNFEGEIKAIGKNAFRECSSLENFVVPDGVTSLEPSTFYNCSKLTNITLPNSLEFIGDNCFNRCSSLKSIVIPQNVTYMRGYCLYDTSISDVLMYPTTPPEANIGLDYSSTTIYVEDEARDAYQNDAYWNQYYIKSMGEFPGVEIVDGNFRYQLHIFNDDATLISATPDEMGIVNVPTAVTYNDKTYTVTVIGDNSLRNSNIKHVVLPEGIKKLGQSCFNYELKVVNIPSTVDEIYQNCFSGCSSQLKVQVDAQIPTTYGDINLPSGATLYMSDDLKASYSGDEYWNQFTIMPSEELYIDNVNIDGCVYDVYLNKNEVTLKTSDYNGESNYTVKEATAYNGEEYLTTAIADRCFFEKSVLQSITLPSDITSLGSYCFGNCTSLTEITLSESLTTLGEYCFSGCSFSTITLPQNVTSVGNNCFYNCSKMTALLVDAVEPPVCPNGTGLSTDNVTLFVPSESITRYKEDAVWGQFTIKPKEEYSFKEEVVGDLKYKLFNYNNVATVIANGYDKPSAYTIPESITAADGNSYTVTAIDNGAFKDCSSITGITLPNTIVRLGDQCFAGCSSITTTTIPNGITTWGEYCFSGCTSLKEINFEDGLESLGDRTFYGCSSLKSVTIPDCIKTIGEDCFANCDNLKSMLLTSATPPTCNNSLGLAKDATIYVESSLVETYNTAEVWQNYTIATREGYPAGEYTTGDGYKYIYYPYSLKATLIANNYNSNATFTVPKSFEKDGETYTVNAIGENCFTGCDFINEIAIPSNINSVAANCFDGCNALKSVMMEGANPPSSTSVIYLPNSAVIYVDDANLQAYKASDTWNQNTIKSKMEYAGQEVEEGGFKYLLYPYAGEACLLQNNYDKPEPISIPSTFTSGGKTYTVTAIGNDCFKDCSRITGITIPESVIRLGDQCFAGCSGITAITIPNSITSWGEYCFLGCGGLKDITLSEGLSSIGKYAFYNCGALKAITIPESITSIGEGVFADCYEMEKILMTSATPPTCSGGLGLRDEAKVYVPEDVVDVYNGTDYWNSCNIVSRAEYPMGDYVIGGLKYTLYPYSQKATLVANNYSDTKIDIPGSVTNDGVTYTVDKIADNCFYGCNNLNEVILPETIVSIGDNCFGECNALTTVLSLASTPPVCTGNLALGSNAKVYVANENIETYQNDSNWGQSKVESYDKFAVETIADRGEFKYRLYPFTLKATLLGNSYSNSTTIEVPETTIYDGKTYQVTGIGKYCFYTCSSVTEIVLPNTITTIEDWAFAECSSLVKLTLPENVSNIGQNVFKKTSKLENIKCLATTPPSCTGDLLFKDGATIYVPSESVDTYKHAMYWEVYEIKNVDEFADGIYAPIMDADDDVKVYDLNGLRLEAKGKGLRILRSKGKTKKVVVK